MNEQTFITKVTEYCELDAQIKELEKQKTALKADICGYMDENRLSNQEVEGWKLVMSVSERTTVNEDKLLMTVKGWNVSDNELIKTREYVDTDRLENLVYNGAISQAQLQELDSCRTVKETVALRTYKRW